MDVEILIVGAGPVGLLLARLLRRRGVDALVVEKRRELPVYSMAIGITPPSLEILESLGLAEEFIARGVKITEAQVHENGRYVGRVSFGKVPSAYRFILAVPQAVTLEIVGRDLPVRRGAELTGFTQDAAGVSATVGGRIVRCRYLIGCDGARSAVRELAGIGTRRKTYRARFVMGDFPDTTGWGAEAHLFFSARGAVESFPLPGGRRRWIAQLPGELPEGGTGVTEFQPQRLEARRFYRGRAVLCGDAAHVMSPIGGQGMNTGFAAAALLADELAGARDFGRYERVRRRVFRDAAARAARGMWLGTRRGAAWSAVRGLFIRDVLLRPGMRERVATRFAMLSLVDLTRRQMLAEAMDEPDCDPVKLARTYRQFRWINATVARSRAILRRHVLADMAAEPNRAYRLVDVGAGGCEIAAWLLRAARRRGLRLTVTAIDLDARAVAWAKSRYGGEPGLEIRQWDAFAVGELGPVDYVFANHFLHHLPDLKIVEALRRVAQRRVVISDLERDWFSYRAFSVLAGLLFHRSYTRADGLLSIRKGFTVAELAPHGRVERWWPGRLVLVADGLPGCLRPAGRPEIVAAEQDNLHENHHSPALAAKLPAPPTGGSTAAAARRVLAGPTARGPRGDDRVSRRGLRRVGAA